MPRSSYVASAALLLCVGAPMPGLAALHVPDDFATIALALQSAGPGDSVIVACGTYSEFGLVLPAGVSLLGATGDPGCVVIDGGLGGTVLLSAQAGQLVRIEGITIAHGAGFAAGAAEGGGLRAVDSSIEISRCRFDANQTDTGGGAIYAMGSTLFLADTDFTGNHAVDPAAGFETGGAISADATSLEIENCVFAGNGSTGSAGAINLSEGTTAEIRGTVFRENHASARFPCAGILVGIGVSLILDDCLVVMAPTDWLYACEIVGIVGSTALVVANSTFVALGESTDGAFIWTGSGTDIAASLFVAGPGVAAVRCGITAPLLTCCNLFSETGEAWAGCIADQLGLEGNVSVDPQFCGLPGSDNYYLRSDSPCAPANNTCGVQIGALPVGCETMATQPTSVSAIKSLY